jgi:CRP/FNR family transcriptional regulator
MKDTSCSTEHGISAKPDIDLLNEDRHRLTPVFDKKTGADMKTPINFQIQHRCSECTMRGEGYFCSFEAELLAAFEGLKLTNTYPRGATLFFEGEQASGVYMLCRGRVKLSSYSSDGKALILRIADGGEILGLSAAIGNGVHEVTAEVIENCQVNFVRRDDFLRFLHKEADVGFNALQQLTRNYHAAHTQLCSLGLSNSVGDKLAKLFLGWCESADSKNGRIHLKVSFSHEEIAEMIGTSRETVTRLLKDFRTRDLITLKGSDLYINDRHRLEAAIGTKSHLY